jgi:hypothetical protein
MKKNLNRSVVSTALLCGLMTFCFTAITRAQSLSGGRILDATAHHLGEATIDKWSEASAKPKGTRLDLRFNATPNLEEFTLAITHREVTGPTDLQLNGKSIGQLTPSKKRDEFYYPIPPNTLVAGENVLSVVPATPQDDMTIGGINLHEQSFRDLFHLETVTVSVADLATGKPVPARITVCDRNHNLQKIYRVHSTEAAMRLGLIYTRGTETRIELPQGDYVFYATRGMEWSRGRQELSLHVGKSGRVQLGIRREVDTKGFIAADTHMHTLTFSGHGDATVEERMMTLAGEGIEMAVSTDHNHNTDYRPFQTKLALNQFFTPVTGNEVSTLVGHINAFPMDPLAAPPESKLNNWVQLVDGIRAKGPKVVALNHPRWVPLPIFDRFGLNRSSGGFAADVPFPFDAMELANALTPHPDPLYIFHDWFALLNRGNKITALATSDSHTVGEPVGQGRSYIPSATDDPARVDVDDACKRLLAGQTTIALGIFADARVNDRFKMGDLVPVKKGKIEVQLRVASSSWIKPRRAILFVNGQQVAEMAVPCSESKPTDARLKFTLAAPRHDAYLVCVVLGEGVSGPWWKTAGDFTLAATNPIYLDVDRDGHYSNPRATAGKLLATAGPSAELQWQAMQDADDGIVVQMASLLRAGTDAGQRPAIDQRVRDWAKKRPAIQAYLDNAIPAKIKK